MASGLAASAAREAASRAGAARVESARVAAAWAAVGRRRRGRKRLGRRWRAASEAPKGLAPGGDELAEADGSHCEAVALEHERAQPDGRARVGDELARLEVLLVEQRRPLGTSLPRASHVPRASLPRADCLQPRCISRFVARSYHPPAKGDLVMSWRQSNGTRAAKAQRAHLSSSNLLSAASICVGGAFRCCTRGTGIESLAATRPGSDVGARRSH